MTTMSYPDGLTGRPAGSFIYQGEKISYWDLRVRFHLPNGAYVDGWVKLEKNENTGELNDVTPPSWRTETKEAMRRALML